MRLVLVGLNHKTAPIEIREKFAIPESGMGFALAGMLEYPEVMECAIISTCNRVEIYSVSDNAYESYRHMKEFLARHNSSTVEEIEKYLYSYRGLNAVRHIFRVASSLDSMVLGEPQILGQVKDAYEFSLKFNASGPFLNKLFPKTFSVAKRVRTDTKIAASAVSVSYAAVELAKKIFSQLNDKTVMVIGAGEMAELACRHLVSSGVTSIMVTNRTFERAVKLAEEFQGNAIRFEEYKANLKRADIVISATGAPGFIVTKADITEVIKQRRNRTMFLIDIADPRDIDPSANEVDNIYLYDIDDLQSVVEENIGERQVEAKKAEEIVLLEVNQFQKWFESYLSAPIIVELRKKFDYLRDGEVKKALSNLKNADEKTLKTIQALSNALMNKFLHEPITVLKKGEQLDNGMHAGEAIKKIFRLDEEEEASPSEERDKVER
ncbi:MAG: glutamyl-tRNA reductase [Deltaproteobacteria bacterium]|nr:glutamyl-tRNA reductase [Deltaproteobacteria bacterium]